MNWLRNRQHKIIQNCVTVLGVGHLPKAPGTWASLVTLPLGFVLLQNSLWLQIFCCLLGLVVGVIACQIYELQTGRKDPSEAVIDEVVGQLIALLALPSSVASLVLAFLLFRFFDILKPFPIRYLDQKVKGGLGVMLDDVAAGLAASFVLQGLLHYPGTQFILQWGKF